MAEIVHGNLMRLLVSSFLDLFNSLAICPQRPTFNLRKPTIKLLQIFYKTFTTADKHCKQPSCLYHDSLAWSPRTRMTVNYELWISFFTYLWNSDWSKTLDETPILQSTVFLRVITKLSNKLLLIDCTRVTIKCKGGVLITAYSARRKFLNQAPLSSTSKARQRFSKSWSNFGTEINYLMETKGSLSRKSL